MPLVRPFRTSFGTQTRREVLLVRAVTRRRRGLGRVRRDGRPAVLARSTSTRAARRDAPLPDPPRCAAERLDRGAGVGAGCSRRSRATGWRRPPWRWRCSTPSCAPPASPLARDLGAVRDRVPSGVSVGIMDSIPRAARRRRRLPRRGLRADQAQDRAGLGRRAGARRARAVRRRRAAAGRREHRVHARATRGTSPGSTRSTCC